MYKLNTKPFEAGTQYGKYSFYLFIRLSTHLTSTSPEYSLVNSDNRKISCLYLRVQKLIRISVNQHRVHVRTGYGLRLATSHIEKNQQPDDGEKQTIPFRFHYFVRKVADWVRFSRVRSHL